jgi:hypothetical protein
MPLPVYPGAHRTHGVVFVVVTQRLHVDGARNHVRGGLKRVYFYGKELIKQALIFWILLNMEICCGILFRFKDVAKMH